jgi:hypothetical protein
MIELSFKQELLAYCIQLKIDNVENLKSAMNEAQQSAVEYGSPKDRYDSYRAQMLAKRDMFAQQVQNAQEELLLLQRIDTAKPVNKAGFGALVFLPDQIVFIAIGLGKVEFKGRTCFVVSLHVPLSIALKDKMAGDVIDFRGKKMEILNLY